MRTLPSIDWVFSRRVSSAEPAHSAATSVMPTQNRPVRNCQALTLMVFPIAKVASGPLSAAITSGSKPSTCSATASHASPPNQCSASSSPSLGLNTRRIAYRPSRIATDASARIAKTRTRCHGWWYASITR